MASTAGLLSWFQNKDAHSNKIAEFGGLVQDYTSLCKDLQAISQVTMKLYRNDCVTERHASSSKQFMCAYSWEDGSLCLWMHYMSLVKLYWHVRTYYY